MTTAAPDADEASGGSDGHEAGDGAGEQADELGLLLEGPGQDQPGDGGHGGGDVGVDEGQEGDAVNPQLAAGIEAVPAEPQEGGAQGDEGDVVQALSSMTLALPT